MKEENIQLLELSKKEILVLNALKNGKNTPSAIFHSTKVTRPTVYEILKKLKKRGIIKSQIKKGRKYWKIKNRKQLEEKIYQIKKYLLNISNSTKEVFGKNDSNITVYHGTKDIRQLVIDIAKENKNQRIIGIQGNNAEIGWSNIFNIEITNKLNRLVKENKIIMEVIMPIGWFEKQIKIWGKKWAKDFSGRMTVAHEIDKSYFQHGAQLFATKKAVYLLILNENIAIEIRNSEIQKMILSMFYFIQNNSQKINPNEVLKNLILKNK